MKCPVCANTDSKVIDSRPTEDSSIRRRRECLSCQKRFTTYEIVEAVPLAVIKKNKTREVFDPNKIIAGLRRACYKRPVYESQMANLVSEIETELANSLRDSVTSEEIGNLVMKKLRKIDEVSYVRFASVYQEFKDVETFMDALKSLYDERKS